MEKLKMQSMDKVQYNIEKIREMFPNAVTEVIDGYVKDEKGNEKPIIKLKVDFDVLKQELADTLIDERELRYQFTWPDKQKSILLANTPVEKTLRPDKEKSVDFDNTQNLYIEGDNLDVLKLLRETYLNKIKMIYIDPPYNTGNDFVYEDDFAEDSEQYLEGSGQYDEQGNRLFQNTESNGRFHTDWLNMIYPRLKVAKDLLSDDGVIFISIDDNEVDNLRKICDEVFGRDNFINIITVKTKVGGVSGSSEGKSLKDATEYILSYARNKQCLEVNPVYIKTKLSDKIKQYNLMGKSWKYTSIITKLSGKKLIKSDSVRELNYYGYEELETKSITAFAKEMNLSEEEVYNKYAHRIFQTTNAQSSVRQTVIEATREFDYPMYGCEYKPIKGKNEGTKIEILYKGDQRRMMMFLSDSVKLEGHEYYYLDKITTLWDDIDYNNLTKEGDMEFPNGKKPIKLLQRMLELTTDKDSTVMDFFSGSASTAHAVMQLNAEDGGNRKFIMVQLPEPCDEKSEAYKAGYKTICDIGEERIRRAGKKIKAELEKPKQQSIYQGDSSTALRSAQNDAGAQLDIGFRVLRLDSSNMREVYYHPEQYTQTLLDSLTDNIKEDRTPLDLLFQVMLDLGVKPSARIEEKEIAGKRVFVVNDNELIACFDDEITDEVVKAIAKCKPLYAAFRDSSLASDSVAANFDQIFATYSPNTKKEVL